MTDEQRIERLALSFPSIRSNVEMGYVPGISPWDPTTFYEYLAAPAMEHGSGLKQALGFIWYVWSGRTVDANEAFDFDLRMAFGRWDPPHEAAWKAWAAKAWWA
jgi:hypothetical protein